MHIGMIHFSGQGFPPDIRIDKEAKALAKHGFQVYILTNTTNDDYGIEKYDDNIFICRVHIDNPAFVKRLFSRFSLIKTWYFKSIEEFIAKYQIDILHVHDFNLVPTTTKIALKHNIPVVSDLHENMPAALIAYRTGKPLHRKILSWIINNYHIWKAKEKQFLPLSRKVIIVTKEAGKRLLKYGIPNDKITIVSNTENKETFSWNPENSDLSIANAYASQWVISYVGGIGPHRGIDTVLKAIPYVKEKIKNLKLVIVGASHHHQQELNTIVANLNIQEYVDIIGWQPFEKVNSYIHASSVCLVPHNDFEHTQTTVPHKLFQYMLCKKTVLVSNCKPLERIIQETDGGYVFQANDHKDLAAKLVHIHNNPDEAISKGINAQKAATGKYSWDVDSRNLIQMYTDLEKELRQKPCSK